jgi:hypothetical protein
MTTMLMADSAFEAPPEGEHLRIRRASQRQGRIVRASATLRATKTSSPTERPSGPTGRGVRSGSMPREERSLGVISSVRRTSLTSGLIRAEVPTEPQRGCGGADHISASSTNARRARLS